MNCLYFYKNKKFNNEAELNDFLVESVPLKSKYGDLVFELNQEQLHKLDIIETQKEETEKLVKTYSLNKKQMSELSEFDDSYVGVVKPWMGVSEYMKSIRKPNGDLAFPEMIKDNYFNQRYKDWINGNFKDEGEIKDLFGTISEARPIDEKDLPAYRAIIEDKWESLHLFGSEIHAALQAFWSKDSHGKNVRSYSDDFLINTYLPSKINRSILPSDKLPSIVEYARALEKDLTRRFGEDAQFYPEYKVTSNTNQVDAEGNPIKLLGILDLLIVDKDYNCHFIDYKASDKPYSQFNSAKQLTYFYQFSIYDRLLRANNVEMANDNIISVAPIQMTGYKRLNNKWTFDKVTWEGDIDKNTNTENKNLVIHDITEKVLGNMNIIETVQVFLPAKNTLSIQSTNLEEKDIDWMQKAFEFSDKDSGSDAHIAKIFKAHAKKNPETNQYDFKWGGKDDKNIKSFDTEKAAFDFIKAELANFKANIGNITESLGRSLTAAQKENNSNFQFNFDSTKIENKGGSTTWLNSFLNRYTNSTWEVLKCDAVTPFGMLLLRNKYSGQIDCIKLTDKLTKDRLPMGKYNGTTLLANFKSDTEEMANTDSMALEAVNGNIELMESMFILNNLGKTLFRPGDKLGRIQIVNPKFNSALSAENKELMYNFNELAKNVGLDNNLYQSEDIKLMTHYDLVRSRLYEVVQLSKTPEKASIYNTFSKFNSTISDMDIHYVNTDLQMQELLKLKSEMEQVYPNEFRQIMNGDYEASVHPEIPIYNEIMLSIAELKGYNFRQQLSDHDKWLSTNIFKLRGTYIDNPGNLGSSTLNVVTQMVTEAYQNVRTDLESDKGELLRLVTNLKKEKGFNYLKETTFGNQVDLYKNIIDFRDEDIFIKKPTDPSMTKAEQEFADFFLQQMNSRRYSDNYKNHVNSAEYYQIPLAVGGNNSLASREGMLKAFKDRLSYWTPKKVVERVKQYTEGFFDEQMENEVGKNRQDIWEMTNLFDYGFDHREDALKSLKNPELNLETLLLKYQFACSMKSNLDAVFPVIRASLIHLTYSGELQNSKFDNDIQYLKDYVKNKIFNRSILNDRWRLWTEPTKAVMRIASKLCLSFSPVQFPYQMLDGIWKDSSLILRKPDGTMAFSAKNMKDAYMSAIKDIVHVGNQKTKCQLLNEFYGLNDMDMNNYIDHIKTDTHGFWSFWSSMAFKFASRPDFYNRLTIFGAQMRGDGCWDAHKIVDGRLVYDWKLDKRFDAFANNDKSDIDKYNAQRGLYISTAKQMIREHTIKGDGTAFKMGDALPKAYTTQQSEGYKSLSDKLYGYYAHEKKSLVHATAVGAMMMQMKTYWSGKKNQYLAPGGIYIQGRMVQKEENGTKYWYSFDKNGKITDIPTTENTGVPYMVWQGRWEEGIASTVFSFYQAAKQGIQKGGFGDVMGIIKHDLWNNPDENIRTAYRSNIKQLAYDLNMCLIVGTMLTGFMMNTYKDAEKDNKKQKTLESALYANSANFGYKVLKNSFDDFNFIKTIGGSVGEWTPFSISYLGTTAKNWYTLFTDENKTFADAAINTFSVTKQLKPTIDYFIDPMNPKKNKHN